jgi:translation initiation factor 2B subunit (eIF-2B alpha/beta/delta family)
MAGSELKARRLRELVEDRARGASELARLALEFLSEYARLCPSEDVGELLRELVHLSSELEAARPSMVAVENLVGQWKEALSEAQGRSLEEARALLIGRAESLREGSERAVESAAAHASELLDPGTTVLTHSLSSTVRAVFQRVVDRQVRVLFTESRPGLEGHRLAEHLAKLGIPAQLISEAQMGQFVSQAQVALTGADAVLGDGSVVNKVGTYLLALAAREHRVPFYVCYESFKRTRRTVEDFELEEMDPAELGCPLLPGITARNIYFDVTPAYLVSCWIDEKGVHGEFQPPLV